MAPGNSARRAAVDLVAHLSGLPPSDLAEAVKLTALSRPEVKQMLLDAWLEEEDEADGGSFLASARTEGWLCGECGESLTWWTRGDATAAESHVSQASPDDSRGSRDSDILEKQIDRASARVEQGVARRRTLVIAYLPRNASESDVAEALGRFSTVSRVRVAREESGASRCYGFVEFADEASTEKAFAACRYGRVVLDDDAGHTWHLKASRSKRATAGPPSRRRRGARGKGQSQCQVNHQERAPAGDALAGSAFLGNDLFLSHLLSEAEVHTHKLRPPPGLVCPHSPPRHFDRF